MPSVIKIKKYSWISFSLSIFLHTVVFILIFKATNKKPVADNKLSSSELIDLGEFQIVSRPKNNFKTSSRKVLAGVETQASLSKSSATDLGSNSSGVDLGQGSKGGDSGRSAEGTTSTTSIKQKYFLEFRKIVESKKNYPILARQREIQGIVIVSVIIKKNGEVTNHQIIKGSGHDILDQVALNLVKKITLFESIPDELGKEDIELKLPIAYQLDN